MNDFEDRLRREMADRAQRAPDGDALAEQIIAMSSAPTGATVIPMRPRRHWRSWTFPLVAAAAVAAVVLALVGVSRLDRTPQHVADPGQTHSVQPNQIQRTTSPATPRSAGTVAPTGSGSASVDNREVIPLLNNVRVLDLSFVSDQQGWALATADCLAPAAPTTTCTAMLHTTNGGTSWQGMPTPPANVPVGGSCAAPCVEHIRFATDRIGYAFGPSTLFMTRDGGASWVQQTGGADALETLEGNVIRVVRETGSSGTGTGTEPTANTSTDCSSGCAFGVEIAPLGSPGWEPVKLPTQPAARPAGVAVALARTNGSAYLAVFGSAADGATTARTTLFHSADRGASWTRGSEPCGSHAMAKADSEGLTSGADGSVTVLCRPRQATTGEYTSTVDTGRSAFVPGQPSALYQVPAGAVTAIGSASGSTLIVAATRGAYRSTDGGQSFSRLGGVAPADARWIGFQSSTTGRAISADGTTIWTTRDAGQTWSAHVFG